MEFSRPGYWSGYPFPSPGDLPNPGIELGNWTQQSGKSDPGIGSSPALQVNSLPTELEFFTTIVPHELTANQKNNCHFEVSSLILYNKKPFLNQTVTCDKKWTLYNHQQQPAQWPDQEAAPKHFPNQTSTKKKKKRPITNSHGHCLVVCCPSEPLQLSESLRNHYIWEACLANQRCTGNCNTWSPALVKRMGPILLHDDARQTACHTTNTSKFERTGLSSFTSPTIFNLPSHRRTNTSSSMTTTFCRENASTASRR